MPTYVAFLRAINLGKNRKFPMADVRRVLTTAGFTDVETELVYHRNVYQDADHWVDWTWSAGARLIWERVPPQRRDGIVIAEDEIASLKRFKDDAKEVAEGYECGVTLEKFADVKEGDVYEAFKMEEYRD